ncbi:MAG: DNA polymerase I, partial [Parcubacteria group bacterium]|nr:DNA polymerase I [Parcubacteria group bacterium]
PGIGPKTAIPLIKEYKSLENFLENGQLDKNYLKITKFKEQALLSKNLAQLKCDAPLDVRDLSELKRESLPKENLISYFEKLGFKSLISRIQ